MKNLAFILLLLFLIQSSFSSFADPPEWTVDPANFQFSSSITSVIIINEVEETSDQNILAAFVGEEIRGVATSFALDDRQLFFLTIYANQNGENITFKSYKADEDIIVEMQEFIIFNANDIIGDPENPFELYGFLNFDHPPVVSGIPGQLIEQNNSFSSFDLDEFLNSPDGDPVVWSFSGNTELEVTINGENIVDITYPNDFIGEEFITFIATDNTESQLSGSQEVNFKVRTEDIAPELKDIPDSYKALNGNFNVFNLNDFVANSDGDEIRWSYQFDPPLETDPIPNWTVNPTDFQFNLNITASVNSKGIPAIGESHLLAAMVNDEVRGIATPQLVNENWIYFLTVYSNTEGENVIFRFYDNNIQEEIPVNMQIEFNANNTIGNPINPLALDAGNILLILDAENNITTFSVLSDWIGTETVTFTANEFNTNNQLSTSENTTFSVVDNYEPIVTGIPNQFIEVGSSFESFDLDGFLEILDGDEVLWSFSGNSDLSVNIDAFNVVTITAPNSEWVGSEEIIFTVSDQNEFGFFRQDTARFSIREIDVAPVISDLGDQLIGLGGMFHNVVLDDFVSITDGDEVAWRYEIFPPENPDPIPNWEVTPSDYQFSMNIIAMVNSEGKLMTGVNHILEANVDGQTRGVGQAIYIEPLDQWFYYITVYSNEVDETIQFRFFDNDKSIVVPIKETLLFEDAIVVGSPHEPFHFQGGHILVDITENNEVIYLIVDPQWTGEKIINFIATDINTINTFSDSAQSSLTIISDFTPIISGIPDQLVQFGEEFQSFDLDDFIELQDADEVSYSVLNANDLIISIDNENNVNIDKPDPEWSGSDTVVFLVTDNTDNGLFDSDTVVFTGVSEDHAPEINPVIPNQKTGLNGTFSSLLLNNYLSEIDGDDVEWSYSFPPNANPENAPEWNINPADYQFSMTITAKVSSLGNLAIGEQHLLGAFDNDELRGVASAIEVNDGWVYFMVVYANEEGENLKFSFFDNEDKRLLPVKQQVVFEAGGVLGEPLNPFAMDAGELLVTIENDIAIIEIIDSEWIGAETIEWKVKDINREASLFDTQEATYTVENVAFPIIADIPNQLIAEGENFVQISLNDFLSGITPSEVNWSFIGNQELGISVDENGLTTISVPDENYNGEEIISFIATSITDSELTANDIVKFTVLPVNDAPVFTSFPPTFARVGTFVQYAITSEDPDNGDDWEISASKLPDWLTLEDLGNGTAVLSGIPLLENRDENEVVLNIRDAQGLTDNQAFSIFVNAIPQFESSPILNIDEDDLYSYVIVTSDFNIQDELIINANNLPGWLILTKEGNRVSRLEGTPLNEDIGSHSISLVVTDIAGDTDIQDFDIIVTNTNDAPVFDSEPILNVTENETYEYHIKASDVDPDDSVSVSIISLPEWLSFAPSENGEAILTGIPINKDIGFYTIQLNATDLNQALTLQQFQIEVKNINNDPSDINLSDNQILENQPILTFVGVLSSLDLDDEDIFSYQLVTGEGDSDNGSFVIENDSLKSSEVFNFENRNTHSIRVQTNDGEGGLFQKQFLLSVIDVNEPPTVSDIDDVEIGRNASAGPFSFIISDPETTADELTVTMLSSNQNILPDANITLGGIGVNRDFSLQTTRTIGDVTVTVNVSDGINVATTTFDLIGGVTNINENELLNTKIILYPNPVLNEIEIQFNTKWKGEFYLNIISVSGQIIFESTEMKENKEFKKKIALSDIPKGVYVISVFNDKHKIDRKILKK